MVSYVWGLVFVVLLGIAVRTRREYTEALVERAHRLEHERDQQARLAAAAERTRIAREMHDIIAHNLSVREREILTVIGQGWSNTEIAARLHLAESTVKTHVTRILAKTGARDRVQAVILAYDTRLVAPM